MFRLLSPNEGENGGTAASRTGRRSWSRGAMHWVRRIHLYSGLLMFPWVMLYGITGLLFNHPGAFSDRPGRTLSRDDFAETALARMADPPADAEQVVAALNARFASSRPSGPPFRLVEPEKAVYSRDVVVARARGTGQEHSVLLDLPSGTAFLTTSEQTEAERAPFAMRGLKVRGSLGDRVKAGLPAALTRQGLAADDAGIAIGAELVFLVEADGQLWRATYHPQTGAVSGQPTDNASDLSTRRFLTQLHLTHGYPSQSGIKWVWALAVDLMSISMILWAISGLLMWWQIKGVRGIGAVVLAVSLILAGLVVIAMHHMMTPL